MRHTTSLPDDLMFLIAEVDDTPLHCGHEHRTPTTAYRCTTVQLTPEDNNMGDEAFVRVDAYL